MGGFDLFAHIKQAILNHADSIDLTVIDKPVQQLTADEDGEFDLIFSNNVMEHIPGWHQAMDAMSAVLSSNGQMLHACPNYTVPYEPHYGVPVFRHFPEISRRLFLQSSADTGIWESLNFITCRALAGYCRQNRLNAAFEQGLLYKALKRLEDDPLFADRHQGMVARVARLLMLSGIGNLFRYIPASLATPMIVTIRKSN